MARKLFLSFVLVTRNDEDHLILLLIAIDKILSHFKSSYEILVVNNASQDKTNEVIRKFQLLIKNMRSKQLTTVQQKTTQLISNIWQEIKGQWLIVVDSKDLKNVELLNQLLSSLKGRQGLIIVRKYWYKVVAYAVNRSRFQDGISKEQISLANLIKTAKGNNVLIKNINIRPGVYNYFIDYLKFLCQNLRVWLKNIT